MEANPADPGWITFHKTVRRIEQEAKVMSEPIDQIFEQIPQKSVPYD